MKITVRGLASLKPDPERELFVWDDELSGFGIRLKPSGVGSFLVQYRTAEGVSRRLTLGRTALLAPEEARKLARAHLAAVAKGQDPAQQKAEDRRALTVTALCTQYLAAAEAGTVIGRRGLAKKGSALKVDAGRVQRHIIPLLGPRKVRDLKSPDLVRFIGDVAAGKTAVDVRTGPRGRAIVQGGRGTATRTAGLLGGILSYAVEQGIIETNPMRGVKRPADRKVVVRLDAEQYRALGDQLRDMERRGVAWQAVAGLRLLALTGCRKGEIEGLLWSEVDLNGQAFRLADSKTGASTRPIGKAALAVLKALPRSDEWVLPGNNGHYQGLPKAWARHGSGPGLTLHGLRHAFASTAGDLGLSELIIASLLGHASATVTGRYVHALDAALVAAADAVAQRVEEMMGGSFKF